ISPANWRKKRRRARSAPSSSAGAPPGAGSGEGESAGRSGDGSANGPSLAMPASVLDDGRDSAPGQPVATLEEVELDREGQTQHGALQPLDQLDRAFDRAAGCEEVVHDQHLLPGGDRVAVDLERVRAIFEGVLHRDRLGRELAELADRDDAGTQLV